LHNTKSVVLELLEKLGEGGRRARMDIVQEQNALADRLKSAHCERNDLIGFDMAMPIVGIEVGREDDQAPRGELAFEDVGAGKAGDAEERRQISDAAKVAPTSEMPQSISWRIFSTGNWPKRNGWSSLCVPIVWPSSYTRRTTAG
jgi:hypothetical protein